MSIIGPHGQQGQPAVDRWMSYAEKYGSQYGVPSNLILGDIQAESGGNPTATSATGAMGLMQLEPGTAASLGVTNAYNPQQNIQAGTKYLAQMKAKFGTWTRALEAYNAGPAGGTPASAQQYAANVERYAQAYQGITGSRSIAVSSGGGASGSGPSTSYGGGSDAMYSFLVGLHRTETGQGLGNPITNFSQDIEWVALKAGLILLGLVFLGGGILMMSGMSAGDLAGAAML